MVLDESSLAAGIANGVAASTDVIARQLLWKVPRKIGGFLNFKMLLLTRMGEGLFRYLRPCGFEKFLHGPGNGLRGRMINSIGAVSVRQFGLAKLDLIPAGQMQDIVRGAIGLASEGFFEGVEDGSIAVHRNRTITRLFAGDDGPAAELGDGRKLRADLVLCATGFTQGVPFLPEATDTHHCRGTKIIPFSMHNVDEVLGDLDLSISAPIRASHWLNPVNAAAYRRLTPLLLRRLTSSGPRLESESPREPGERDGSRAVLGARRPGPSVVAVGTDHADAREQ